MRSWNGTLVLETMYYADEVRQPDAVDGKARLEKPEVDHGRSRSSRT
jgi:non-homologous end joining protein Ku